MVDNPNKNDDQNNDPSYLDFYDDKTRADKAEKKVAAENKKRKAERDREDEEQKKKNNVIIPPKKDKDPSDNNGLSPNEERLLSNPNYREILKIMMSHAHMGEGAGYKEAHDEFGEFFIPISNEDFSNVTLGVPDNTPSGTIIRNKIKFTQGNDQGAELRLRQKIEPSGHVSLNIETSRGTVVSPNIADMIMKLRIKTGDTMTRIPKSQWGLTKEDQQNLWVAAKLNNLALRADSYDPDPVKNPKEYAILMQKMNVEIERQQKVEEAKQKAREYKENIQNHGMSEINDLVSEMMKSLQIPEDGSKMTNAIIDNVLDASPENTELYTFKELIKVHGQLLSALGYKRDENGQVKFENNNLSHSVKDKILTDLKESIRDSQGIDLTSLKNALYKAGGDENTPSITMNMMRENQAARQAKKGKSLGAKISRFFKKSNDNKPEAPKNDDRSGNGPSGPVQGQAPRPAALPAPKPPGLDPK